MSRTLKSLVSFWLWVGVVLVSFMLIVVSIAADAIPQVVVTVFAVVIFGAAIAVLIVNPGIFARQTTAATGT